MKRAHQTRERSSFVARGCQMRIQATAFGRALDSSRESLHRSRSCAAPHKSDWAKNLCSSLVARPRDRASPPSRLAGWQIRTDTRSPPFRANGFPLFADSETLVHALDWDCLQALTCLAGATPVTVPICPQIPLDDFLCSRGSDSQ